MLSFQALGLIVLLLSIVSLVDVVRHRRQVLDDRYTGDDRLRVTRFVLFVLLPLSVLAHEGGHALAVWLFGGTILEVGFYGLYGYVAHAGVYTSLELAVIALAGTLVNVALAIVATAMAWYRPARRPAINHALFVFAGLQLLNALVFYPLLDAGGGIAGDWQTIYSRETPVFSALVALDHLALLVAMFLVTRSERFKAGYAARTGDAPRPLEARVSDIDAQQQVAGVLAVAAALATNGWRHEVRLISDTQAGGSQVIMRWESGGFQRALLVHATLPDAAEPHVELHAAVEAPVAGTPAYHRELLRIDGHPTARELVPWVRRYLDFVDSWNGSTVISPN